ncbi:hypothetical protein B0T21DRAFT_398092 [Apiosordaria backusii]|uniref:Uncharacterized protein n=1 Tax=Apiosordaria backusii TaxID=314023 RepID=A0AA40EYC2_9PEZI|nr:hypothetical protein B0T21DRAFT_398092 [Apiosordaria backusii]
MSQTQRDQASHQHEQRGLFIVIIQTSGLFSSENEASTPPAPIPKLTAHMTAQPPPHPQRPTGPKTKPRPNASSTTSGLPPAVLRRFPGATEPVIHSSTFRFPGITSLTKRQSETKTVYPPKAELTAYDSNKATDLQSLTEFAPSLLFLAGRVTATDVVTYIPYSTEILSPRTSPKPQNLLRLRGTQPPPSTTAATAHLCTSSPRTFQ